jgi:hypothetical protein
MQECGNEEKEKAQEDYYPHSTNQMKKCGNVDKGKKTQKLCSTLRTGCNDAEMLEHVHGKKEQQDSKKCRNANKERRTHWIR